MAADAFADSSLIGTAASMCADRGEDPALREVAAAYVRRRHASPERISMPVPLPEDQVPRRLCLRSGILTAKGGQHATALDCIGALRDRLARWE